MSEREHRRPTTAEWPVLDELRRHIYQYWEKGTVSEKLRDPGWHPCRCGWEGYWTDWQPHVAQMVVAAVGGGLVAMGERLEQRSAAVNRISVENAELRAAVARVEKLAAGWEALGGSDVAYHWDRLAEQVRGALAGAGEAGEGGGDEAGDH